MWFGLFGLVAIFGSSYYVYKSNELKNNEDHDSSDITINKPIAPPRIGYNILGTLD